MVMRSLPDDGKTASFSSTKKSECLYGHKFTCALQRR